MNDSTSPPPCSCEHAGWCKRHGIEKTEVQRQLCQKKAHYRQAWDEKRLQGQRITGLGDCVERFLGPVGRAYKRWRKGQCGCAHRQQRLNQLFPMRKRGVVVDRKKGNAFRKSDDNVRFITAAQLQQDIKLLIGKIPPDITAIAGVARSGLSAATMISMYLHLPMITIRQTLNDIVPTGNGWRLGGSRHVDPTGKILVVDDTVMTGNSLRAIAPLVERELGNAMYAAVYVNPLASRKPDIWAIDLGWPHLLEWNLFNSILSPSMAVDFDGILCQDCPHGCDDDGVRYRNFIQNAPPLYVPRRVPIPLIVTARIERYREDTENWLRRHGIAWQRLVMHPATTLRERQQEDIAAFKAWHYSQWASKHKARPGPTIFCESEDRQARRIAQISKHMVICPHTAGVY